MQAATFPAQLIRSLHATPPPPTPSERIRCARVALREAARAETLPDAQAWCESALRMLEAVESEPAGLRVIESLGECGEVR